MLDWLLDEGWDLALSPDGDIRLVNSIPQAILVRLKWIEHEWRLGPEFGFPWFSEVLKKNPSIDLITQRIRAEIVDVTGVVDAKVKLIKFDTGKRSISFRYWASTDTEKFEEEVELYV